MFTTRDMAKEVVDWAQGNENVRVVVLTASRSNPQAPVSVLSDFDIELYVDDLEPFLEGHDWLKVFGEILVIDPYKPELCEVTITEHADGSRQVEGNAGSMVIFKDGPRIDFGIHLTKDIEEDIHEHGGYTNDMGYEILLDKDGLIRSTIPPTYSEFWTKEPTEAEYEEFVHSFWWHITYVAKYLYNDELFFAKYMLDGGLRRHFLFTAIAWHIGMQKHWKNNPGANGRWFKKQVDSQLWSEIEATFAGADLEENWKAMFKMAELFGRLLSDVGAHLDYVYPFELDRNVTEYLAEIRNLVAGQL